MIAFGSMAGASDAALDGAVRSILEGGRRIVVQGSSAAASARRACSASARSTTGRSSRAPPSSPITVAPARPTPSSRLACRRSSFRMSATSRYWADRLRRLGVAPAPHPVRGLQAERLAAAALATAADPSMHQRATALASELEKERGLDMAVDAIEALAG